MPACPVGQENGLDRERSNSAVSWADSSRDVPGIPWSLAAKGRSRRGVFREKKTPGPFPEGAGNPLPLLRLPEPLPAVSVRPDITPVNTAHWYPLIFVDK